jgi:hypothetical protein
MKGKRFVYSLIALLVAIIIVGGGWIALNIPLSQHHQLYDYSDASASLPAQIQSGGSISIDWWGSPAPDLYRYTKPRAYATVPMALTVLIVPEAIFRQQSPYCGKHIQATVLDVVRTDNRTGASWYARVITIPRTLHPGYYELLRIASSQVRSACFSNTMYVSA